jgi:hypothetical protein
MAGFDIATLEDEALNRPGVLTPVLDQAGEAIPGVSITILGVDSDVYQRCIERNQQRQLDQTQIAGRVKLRAASLNNAAIETLAHCTVAWEGITRAGAEFPCNFDNAVWLYKHVPWIKEQVSAFMGERANFLQTSLNGSNGTHPQRDG